MMKKFLTVLCVVLMTLFAAACTQENNAVLPDAKPVMTAMLGWKCDISGVRKWEDLPEAARNYVEYVEREIGCHITYVSVRPERDSIIIR